MLYEIVNSLLLNNPASLQHMCLYPQLAIRSLNASKRLLPMVKLLAKSLTNLPESDWDSLKKATSGLRLRIEMSNSLASLLQQTVLTLFLEKTWTCTLVSNAILI